MRVLHGTVAAIILTGLAGASFAQKSKDTLRIAVYEPIASADSTYEPQPQTAMFSTMVFDNLVAFDAQARQTVPNIAQSWRQVDPLTVEFRLREDVRFHDGQRLDADDVVYSFNFLTDPKEQFRTKEARYGIFDRIEKIDAYTVRLKVKTPFAPLLLRLSGTLPIYPRIAHGKFADKSQFGRAPVGTGPYRALSVGAEGIVLERNRDYRQMSPAKPAGKIGRIEIVSVPDVQTQTARLITGQQDVMYHVQSDAVDFLKAQPDIEIASADSVQFAALIFDMSGRSGREMFKDERVRRALIMATDRQAIARAMLPAALAGKALPASLCHEWLVGCASSATYPGYDPATARKLLAEAGYPDGFSLVLTTWGPARPVTEAMEAQWRRIGVKAQIESLAFPAFVKRRSSGQMQAFVALWDNGSGQPDVDQTAAYFFEPDPRNYIKDAEILALNAQARSELDPQKREALYKRIFDRAIAQSYGLPVFRTPVIVAHSRELRVAVEETRRPDGVEFNRVEWR